MKKVSLCYITISVFIAIHIYAKGEPDTSVPENSIDLGIYYIKKDGNIPEIPLPYNIPPSVNEVYEYANISLEIHGLWFNGVEIHAKNEWYLSSLDEKILSVNKTNGSLEQICKMEWRRDLKDDKILYFYLLLFRTKILKEDKYKIPAADGKVTLTYSVIMPNMEKTKAYTVSWKLKFVEYISNSGGNIIKSCG